MSVQIQYRRGTAAEWAEVNPVLAAGEPGWEIDTGVHKTGNGTAAWADLPENVPAGVSDVVQAVESGRLSQSALDETYMAQADAPDITVDQSVGTRVFIGSVMVYGDTGWRELDVPELTAGTLAIRRTGDVISLQLDAGEFDSAPFTITLPRLPVGFRPANRVRDMWLPGLSAMPVGTINCSTGGYLNLYSYNGGTAYFSVRYDTSQAWPTSLPGTPA